MTLDRIVGRTQARIYSFVAFQAPLHDELFAYGENTFEKYVFAHDITLAGGRLPPFLQRNEVGISREVTQSFIKTEILSVGMIMSVLQSMRTRAEAIIPYVCHYFLEVFLGKIKMISVSSLRKSHDFIQIVVVRDYVV